MGVKPGSRSSTEQGGKNVCQDDCGSNEQDNGNLTKQGDCSLQCFNAGSAEDVEQG